MTDRMAANISGNMLFTGPVGPQAVSQICAVMVLDEKKIQIPCDQLWIGACNGAPGQPNGCRGEGSGQSQASGRAGRALQLELHTLGFGMCVR